MIPKFRAWISEADTMINNLKGIDFENETVVLKKFYWEDGFPVEEEVFEVEIGNAILMQSTGLKDKNGKEIFEGDVVKCNGLLGTIESFKAMWICSFVKYNNYQKVGFFAQEIEVVGNVYENPELLEDKE